MDTKVEIKEEDPLSDDVASQNEREFFSKNVTMQTNSDAVLVDSGCDMAIKTEIKSEYEAVTCQNIYEIATSSEIGLNEREFLLQGPVIKVKKYNSDDEMDYKMEIKEEPLWLETENSSNIEDGVFTPVKSPRIWTEAVSANSSGDSPMPSTETSGKNTSFSFGKNCVECERQESDITKLPLVEKYVHLEQSGNCSDMGRLYTKALMTHKGESSHKCNKCEKSFTRLSTLKSHNLIHEGKVPHKCDVCEKRFARLSHLRTHYLIHEGIKPHKCEICEKRFTQLSSLKLHNLIHEGKKPHKCQICEKSFTLLSHLKSHSLIHEDRKLKPHKCEICENRFTRLSDLRKHKLKHGGVKPYKCEICEKRFTELSTLKVHNLIHEGKKPHKCEICEKRFTRLSDLKLHTLIHEGKKPHKCKICEKSFTQLSHLKSHTLTHEGIKPNKCEICEKRFVRLTDLKRHSLIHEAKKPQV